MTLREALAAQLTSLPDSPQDMEDWSGWDRVERLTLTDCLDVMGEILSDPVPNIIALNVFERIAQKRISELRDMLKDEPQ